MRSQPAKPDPRSGPGPTPARGRLLITAGPTYEPIDAVRFIGNRSSGRLGVAMADEGAARGWRVTLLLGPTNLAPKSSQVEVARFRTAADLEALLREHFPRADVLIMAAAVADYRPRPVDGKLRRREGLTLELEPTPDLLAACGRARRAGQMLIGFALEPREGLMESAREKVARKGLDMIVANPLETMDATEIDAALISADGSVASAPGSMSKESFAAWLLDRVESGVAADQRGARPAPTSGVASSR